MRFFSILLFSALGTLLACTSQVDNEAPKAVKAVPVAISQPIKAPTDSIKPVNRRIMKDPARPVNQIDTIYPFDISMKAVDGSIFSSSDILKSNGKPTVVLFWLTTCFPCRVEMKAIQEEVDNWKSETDFNIVAISTDFEKNYDRVVEMVNKNNWSFESYWDMNREFRKVMPGQLNGLPQSFIFDKDGKLAYHKRKYYTGDEHKLYAKVKELAAK
jgi:thiol-disulfide isomerase/thioredoxin